MSPAKDQGTFETQHSLFTIFPGNKSSDYKTHIADASVWSSAISANLAVWDVRNLTSNAPVTEIRIKFFFDMKIAGFSRKYPRLSSLGWPWYRSKPH